MILTVPDPKLEVLLASTVLLARLWPGAVEDVKVMVQLLRLATPSLAEALLGGHVRVIPPGPGSAVSEVTVTRREVVVSAQPMDRSGEPVVEPHLHPTDVWRLAVRDVAVNGQSAFGRGTG